MSNIRLLRREGTETFHRIMHGRKLIGRVTTHADGRSMAIIGKNPIVYGPTHNQVFAEAVAIYLGYANAADMNRKQATARAARAIRDHRAAEGVRQYLNASTFEGSLVGMDKALGVSPDGSLDVEQMNAGFRAFTRSLFPKRKR